MADLLHSGHATSPGTYVSMNISDSQESDNNTSRDSCSSNACELCGIIKFRNKREKLKCRNKWGECMNAEV